MLQAVDAPRDKPLYSFRLTAQNACSYAVKNEFSIGKDTTNHRRSNFSAVACRL